MYLDSWIDGADEGAAPVFGDGADVALLLAWVGTCVKQLFTYDHGHCDQRDGGDGGYQNRWPDATTARAAQAAQTETAQTARPWAAQSWVLR